AVCRAHPSGRSCPTRRGRRRQREAGRWDSAWRSTPKQPGVLGLVMHAREVGAEGRAADLVEWTLERAGPGGGNNAFKRRQDTLTVGWPEREEAAPGGHQVGRDRLQERGERRAERDAVASGGNRDRDRISEWTIPDRRQVVERGARPGRARGIEKGAALRRRLQESLLRWHQRRSQLGSRAQRVLIARCGCAGGVRGQHGVA